MSEQEEGSSGERSNRHPVELWTWCRGVYDRAGYDCPVYMAMGMCWKAFLVSNAMAFDGYIHAILSSVPRASGYHIEEARSCHN